MPNVSSESTPRERLARVITILRRTRMYWRSSLVLCVVGIAISLVVALRTKRDWRSETTVVYRGAIRTGNEQESAAAAAARLGPKLKDMVSSRARLSAMIEELNLFPEKRAKSMLDAVEEMQTHISFRARNSDTYVVSFVYWDPHVAQEVTAKLADDMIADYNRQNVDTATLTRDFLHKELERSDKDVEDASRALANFIAEHPQFQWGLNDSPYAPQTLMTMNGAPIAVGPAPRPGAATAPRKPVDPQLAQLERQLARIDAELAPPPVAAAVGAAPIPTNVADAQKQRDAAAAALASAQKALAEKLLQVTAAHPDAVALKNQVALAQQNLAAADGALRLARTGATQLAYPEASGDDANLDPAEKADLEKQRSSLLRQIASRRAELAGHAPKEEKSDKADKGGDKKKDDDDQVELETEWHRLKLDLDRTRERFKAVQVNARAADLAADAAQKNGHAEMQILDPAYVPTRPDKGRGRVFFAGAAMALFFTFGVAGARVLLDDTLYDEADVEAIGGPPMLVSMPHLGAIEPPPPRAIARAAGADVDPETTPGGWRPPPEPVVHQPPPSRPPEQLPVARPPRRHNATIRFGTPDLAGSDGLRPAASETEGEDVYIPVDARAALRVVERAHALVASMPDGFGYDEPEVEVVGADTSADVFTILHAAPSSALASLRVLRHRLEQKRADAGGHLVVSVVGPDGGEGKTTLAVRLAMILSEAERARVVLVEGNLVRPQLCDALGVRLPEGVGFSHQIHERMTGRRRTWGIVKLGPSFSLLAEPGPEAEYPAALHSTWFESSLAALRHHYDYVVVDGSTVLGTGDANVLETASDGLLVVARSGVTKASALARAAEQLGDRRILGVVLNDVASAPARRRG